MRKFKLTVDRTKAVRGMNKTWTVVLDSELIGLVELDRTTKRYIAIGYAPDKKSARPIGDFEGTPEGMAAAVGTITRNHPEPV